MYPGTWELYTLIASLIVFWSNVVPLNGDNDTYSEPSTLSKITENVEFDNAFDTKYNTGAVPLGAYYFNISIGSIHINGIPSYSNSTTSHRRSETPVDNLTEDYILTKGIGYHKLHQIKVTWNNARKVCMEEHAHLAVINSLREEAILIQLMKNTKWKSAFVGIHNFFEDADWVTVTGESLESTGFTKWTTEWDNVPDDSSRDHCVTLRVEEGMDDVLCNSPHTFICEISDIN